MIFNTISIDKVSNKLFFLSNVPIKPMISASRMYDENSGEYRYQIDVAVYLPKGITNLGLKKWSENNNSYISEPNFPTKSIETMYRQITITFDGVFLKSLLNQDFIEFDLYVMQFNYITQNEDVAKSIFVNYTYDDPETTRGTVTGVRNISETVS